MVPAYDNEATRRARALLVKACSRRSVLRESTKARIVADMKRELANGADPSASTSLRPREPFLHAAASSPIPSLVGLLLDAGADPAALSDSGHSVLHAAATPAALRSLLVTAAPLETRAVIPGSDPPGFLTSTPLWSHLNSGRFENAVLLLEAGADPNAVSSSGRTVFHDALVLANSPGRVGWMQAEEAQRLGALTAMLEAGADAHRADADGQTPADLIKENVLTPPDFSMVDWPQLWAHLESATWNRTLPAPVQRPRPRM